jgi:uncharacterized protein (TIGR04255 family)
MAIQDKRIPVKLKNDAIVEALLEIRFDMSTIPEVFFGRIADSPSLKGFRQQRMPAYSIPADMRQADANLRYQPVFELTQPDDKRALRIGAHVMSCHRLSPYVGWDKFKHELNDVIDILFDKAENLNIIRLGLRYINAISTELHDINSIADLDLKVTVANVQIAGNVNLNFTQEVSSNTNCTVRIATSEFVQGVLPKNTSVLVDVDVFTKEAFRTKDSQEVKKWIEFAHSKEKEYFFGLLSDKSIDALEER